MRILQAIVTLVLAAFAVLFAVVSLLIYLSIDADPSQRQALPILLQATGIATGLALLSAWVWRGFAQHRPWRWLGQAVLVVALVTVGVLITG